MRTLVPLAVLALGSVVAGLLFWTYFIGPDEAGFWGSALFRNPDNHILHEMHEVPEWVSFSSLVAMLSGFAIAWLYYIRAPWLPAATARAFKPLYLFLLNKWYFDELYDFIFVRGAMLVGFGLWKGGDGAVIDGLGPDGIASTTQNAAVGTSRIQTGYVYHYAFAMLIGVVLLVSWYLAYIVYKVK